MQMRAEDLMKSDGFWSVTEREAAEEQRLRRQCMEIQSQIDVVQRAEAIRHAPGFNDFLNAVKGMHALSRDKLVGDGNLTNEGLREVRGRVRGLESVLALLTKPQVTEALASQLVECKTLLAEALRRRPKQPEQTEAKS